MIEQLYVWEEKIRNEDNSLRQRNILLNLLEKLQTVNLNIYDNHSLRRIVAFILRSGNGAGKFFHGAAL